jgi:hypothetical protein
MYSSCINTTAVEISGDSELTKLLVELTDFNITKNRSPSYDWQNFVVKTKRQLNVDAFFKLQVLDDFRNASLQRITVSNSTQNMGRKVVGFQYIVPILCMVTVFFSPYPHIHSRLYCPQLRG